METHTIDVNGKIFGRVATHVAKLLIGKHKTNYRPNSDNGDTVVIANSDKIKFSGKKMEQNIYRHHTGYIGHLRERGLKELFAKRPDEVLRKAVYQMLPKNSLRKSMIKRLQFKQ
ncbi:MAG: 50S ribosomal protein L13 [Parcubacteria group bacterium]|nr:50S ribosomal protein L13 [Parcubacteria group bacterium]